MPGAAADGTSPSADPFAGRTLSHYRIEARLGFGGMGVVYRATDLSLGRTVAIKVLSRQLVTSDEAKARFLREARAASALDHPNIGVIYELGEQDGELFIAMALYDGESLKQRIQRGPVPLPTVLELLRQIAAGLEAAHRAGIVHRDIKPANILLTSSGTVKILDFGLAKLLFDSEAQSVTNAGEAPGTLLYMSPEQVKGQTMDQRTDLWSLGVVAYELVSGTCPFRGESQVSTLHQILSEEPRSLATVPAVPDWLPGLIEQLLRKNPAERPESASEVLRRLEAASQLDASQRVPERKSQRRRRQLPLVVAAAIFAVAAVAISVQLQRRPTAAGGQVKSLIVVPFVNASENPDTEYLSDGIAETLIDNLSRLPNLQVIARTTAFRYKEKDLDLNRLRHELSVDVLLTGRVQQRGDTLVVHADLINLRTGSQLWGERYNRKLTDVLEVASGIAKAISDTLRPQLTAGVQQQVISFHTHDPEAYQLYLRGRYELDKRTPDSLKKSIDYFNQAIGKDPGFALAYAGLADVYNVASPYLGVLPGELFPLAKAAATKALELDGTLAEAHSALALVKVDERDWSGAELEFKKAIQLNPGYAAAHYFYGYLYLLPHGRSDEAIAEIRRAAVLDPFSVIVQTNLAWVLRFGRKYDEAAAQIKRAIEIDPKFPWPYQLLGELHEEKGEYEQAIAAFEKLLPQDFVHLEPKESAAIRLAYAASGAPGYWQKRAEVVRDHAKVSYVPPTYLAMLCMRSGQYDQAFEWLEQAYQKQDQALPLIAIGPAFDSLRSDPRFADLLRRIGLSP